MNREWMGKLPDSALALVDEVLRDEYARAQSIVDAARQRMREIDQERKWIEKMQIQRTNERNGQARLAEQEMLRRLSTPGRMPI